LAENNLKEEKKQDSKIKHGIEKESVIEQNKKINKLINAKTTILCTSKSLNVDVLHGYCESGVINKVILKLKIE